MKSILKYASPFIFILLFLNSKSFAQQKPSFYIDVKTAIGKTKGILIAVNDSALVINSNKSIKTVAFKELQLIKVYKIKNGLVIGLPVAAAIAGNVAVAFTIDNAMGAILVGTVGSVGILTLGILINKWTNPAVLKIKAKDEPINFETISTKLAPYVYKELPKV
jgi:hypothetical protein